MADLIKIDTELKLVCPFRTKTVMSQGMAGTAEQVVTYPECQYAQCPMYNSEGKTQTEKCLQALAVLDGIKNGGVV